MKITAYGPGQDPSRAKHEARLEVSHNFFDFTVQDSNGRRYPLSQHKGKVVLVVNVASKCGFTPQYEGLEKLYCEFKDRGFVILGFPCNQFGKQERGSNAEIQEFCRVNYGVTFPVLAKIEVNGPAADPLYKYLKSKAPGLLWTKAIKWNFTKFLISREGQVIRRFAPLVTPEKLVGEIERVFGETG